MTFGQSTSESLRTPNMVHTGASGSELNPPTSPDHHRFHFLDGLRGIAAILVVMRHAPLVYSHALVSHNSFMAVDFFFCLSGFVIAFSYEKRLQSSLGVDKFVIARMIRLLPIAALGTVLGTFELLLTQHIQGASAAPLSTMTLLIEFILGLMIVPYISPAHLDQSYLPLNGITWTLFVELVANFFYAALVRLRLAAHWIVALVAAGSLVLLLQQRRFYGSFDLGFTTNTMDVALERVGFSFFAGILVYRIYLGRAPRKLYASSAAFMAAILGAAFVGFLCDSSRFTRFGVSESAAICIMFPLIVYLGARVVPSLHWSRVCAFLGTISYPLYILHPPLLWFLGLEYSLHFVSAHPSMATPITIIYTLLLIVTAWVAAEFYESPVRRMLTRSYRSHLALARK